MTHRRLDIDNNKEEIIKLYIDDKLSTPQIGKIMKAGSGTIERRLNDWGVPLRLSGRPDLNERSFDELTPESLYWLGYIAGDGCVTEINKSYRIFLGSKDREQLLKFRCFLRSDHKVEMDYNGNWVIRFSSAYMGRVLVSYGIVPRKSLILDMDKEIVNRPEFLRGLVDSDGSFGMYPQRYSYKLSVYTGSKKFSKTVKGALTHMCDDYEAKVYNYRNGYSICVNQKQQLVKCLDAMYGEAPFLYRLERKYKKAMEIKKCLY